MNWFSEHIPSYVRRCSVRGLQIDIDVSTPIERMRAATYETKEPETLNWIDGHLAADDVLFDVGANIGIYTLYAAKRAPHATVYAFEPESQNFARLCHNLVLNRVRNVTPCNFPLAEAERIDFFYVSELRAGHALHSFGRQSDFVSGDRSPFHQGAFACSIDTAVRKYNLPQPTLMKLDVDGIEGSILAGARATLADPRFRSLLLEWNFRAEGEIEQLRRDLESVGLTMQQRSSWISESNGGLRSQNLIFSKAGHQ